MKMTLWPVIYTLLAYAEQNIQTTRLTTISPNRAVVPRNTHVRTKNSSQVFFCFNSIFKYLKSKNRVMLCEGFHSVHSANPPELVFHQTSRQKVTMNIYPTILCRSGCCVNCAAIHKLRNFTKLTPLTTPCMLGYCNCSLGGESITNLRFSSS